MALKYPRYIERLAEHGIAACTGTVGDFYDDAVVENVNGSYRDELIRRCSWADVFYVENAMFEWVTWWNESKAPPKPRPPNPD
ncbi:hypothetical protein [Corynebacterium striatum]|uniref:hypothetical protein n=1 Tax=Corynebacterium striatum TaxID=43770 RepID=UPI003AEC048B